jgi:hypothetical protein
MSKITLSDIEEWASRAATESSLNLEQETHGSIGFWSEMARLDLLLELQSFIEYNV